MSSSPMTAARLALGPHAVGAFTPPPDYAAEPLLVAQVTVASYALLVRAHVAVSRAIDAARAPDHPHRLTADWLLALVSAAVRVTLAAYERDDDFQHPATALDPLAAATHAVLRQTLPDGDARLSVLTVACAFPGTPADAPLVHPAMQALMRAGWTRVRLVRGGL